MTTLLSYYAQHYVCINKPRKNCINALIACELIQAAIFLDGRDNSSKALISSGMFYLLQN